jgi:transposase-like protein
MSILSKDYFRDEAAAFAYVEAIVWPDGPVCPHCGGMEKAYSLVGVRSKPSKKNPEGVERHGLWKCGHCRGQFTVRKNTIFEESHIPMHKWLQAFHLLCSSKKGMSAHQLHRVLEVQYKTAWFLAHRIREAMRSGELAPFGGGGETVEIDETFIGRDPKRKRGPGYKHKHKVLALVDRKKQRVRSLVVEDLTIKAVTPILQENIEKETHVMTDQAGYYYYLGDHFDQHSTVNHEKGE